MPGLRADVNLIDHSKLERRAPCRVTDFSSGGQRLLQCVDGCIATLVAGGRVFEHGEHTGRLPGRLVRAGR